MSHHWSQVEEYDFFKAMKEKAKRESSSSVKEEEWEHEIEHTHRASVREMETPSTGEL